MNAFTKNKYFIQRHGESEANRAGLITSDPSQCIAQYGLTDHGKNVAAKYIRDAAARGWLDGKTIIYSSDFLRTFQTAKIAQELLGASDVHLTQALRERSFGAYNGKHVDAYIEIWANDAKDKLVHLHNGVENVEQILNRLAPLMEYLEGNHKDQRILLVSHGDPLQVLQACQKGLGPTEARSLPYIQPGEIRELN